jgi:hypothetical protein
MLPPQNSEAPKLAVANTSQFNKGASDDASALQCCYWLWCTVHACIMLICSRGRYYEMLRSRVEEFCFRFHSQLCMNAWPSKW